MINKYANIKAYFEKPAKIFDAVSVLERNAEMTPFRDERYDKSVVLACEMQEFLKRLDKICDAIYSVRDEYRRNNRNIVQSQVICCVRYRGSMYEYENAGIDYKCLLLND